jgi:hypothetical protein
LLTSDVLNDISEEILVVGMYVPFYSLRPIVRCQAPKPMLSELLLAATSDFR